MNAATHQASKLLEQRLPDWKLSYRMDEAAAATGLSRSTLYNRVRAGQLRIVRDGCMTLILRAELERYLNHLPQARLAQT